MNIYWDKLAHVQVVINCRYSVSQLCTCAYILGALSNDDVISYKLAHNMLTTRGWVANGLDFKWDLKSGCRTI